MDLIADTNIAIYLLSGDETIAELLDGRALGVSFITELELLSYSDITEANISTIQDFLSACVIVDPTASVKRLTISIRRNHHLRLPDALVAATALAFDLPLITADRQFQQVNSLHLLQYDPTG